MSPELQLNLDDLDPMDPDFEQMAMDRIRNVRSMITAKKWSDQEAFFSPLQSPVQKPTTATKISNQHILYLTFLNDEVK